MRYRPELGRSGGSGDAKAGTKTAGAARQYNGRLGKVDVCQVGVFPSFVKEDTWAWVDGELFLPERWFERKMAEERQWLGIPTERVYKTKVESGWEMIQRAQANGLPFRAVGCDDLYGRADRFRAQMDRAGLVYMADVPCTTEVYLECPEFGVPETPVDHKGREYSRPCVLPSHKPVRVSQVVDRADTQWHQTKLQWMQRFQRDPKLYPELEVDLLPALPVANVRELLRAAMPLPQLSPHQAAELVGKHLVAQKPDRKES